MIWMNYGASFSGILQRQKKEWRWFLWTAMEWFPGYTVKWKKQNTDKYKQYAIAYVRTNGK